MHQKLDSQWTFKLLWISEVLRVLQWNWKHHCHTKHILKCHQIIRLWTMPVHLHLNTCTLINKRHSNYFEFQSKGIRVLELIYVIFQKYKWDFIYNSRFMPKPERSNSHIRLSVFLSVLLSVILFHQHKKCHVGSSDDDTVTKLWL